MVVGLGGLALCVLAPVAPWPRARGRAVWVRTMCGPRIGCVLAAPNIERCEPPIIDHGGWRLTRRAGGPAGVGDRWRVLAKQLTFAGGVRAGFKLTVR